MSSRACHVKLALRFLALEPVSFKFDNSSLLVRFRCLRVRSIYLSIRKLSVGALYRHKDSLGSP